jgi:hypothetical protein
MKRLLRLSLAAVSGLTSDLTLGADFDGVPRPVFGSLFTFGSVFTLAFCGAADLEGKPMDWPGVSEDFKAETDGVCRSFCVVFLACGVAGGLRVGAGVSFAFGSRCGRGRAARDSFAFPSRASRITRVVINRHFDIANLHGDLSLLAGSSRRFSNFVALLALLPWSFGDQMVFSSSFGCFACSTPGLLDTRDLVLLHACFHLDDMRRYREFLLAESLLQADFCGVLVLRALQAVVYQLCLVPVRDLIFWCFAFEIRLELACGSACMALEGTANVDKESVVIDELATHNEWSGSLHIAVVVG